MVQRLRSIHVLASMKDVPTKFKKEEYVEDMVQSKNATTKDVPTMLSKEVSVKDMVQG